MLTLPKIKQHIILWSATLCFGITYTAKAAGGPQDKKGFMDTILGSVEITGKNLTGSDKSPDLFPFILVRVLNALLAFLGIVFLGLFIYAGYLWLNARGKEETVAKAKRLMFDATIGLIIIVAARIITILILHALIESGLKN
ncbi:MAG: hypothetical protein COT81_04410 [Candidatus Buchananbacteria bacterium CG10_big_fil_rev_8_21_14_0_10_42_9]|uniref:Uncharacterized protein n=1 Tax=Candidatus Buchananbacteria bacterium CG10_big_fil_rev_8_21_14_0_10_42_9 TaxID=1974526 RepID=A0A2H0W0H8_9BACT|nr:MAG: hypothetical protein COT81_04410 [Candidatus Buchananbacteria bacterium CG10_big_fil_rev_8_21_14_0_10_42_9]